MAHLKKSKDNAGFHLFLFCLFLIVLSWPFLTIADRQSPQYVMFIYLFFVWSLTIVLLFIIGKGLKQQLASGQGEETELSGDGQC
jgi:hypothetical protein